MDRIIREPTCQRMTGLSRSTRWRLEQGGLFPKRIRISPGAIGWREREIIDWIEKRAEEAEQ